MGKDYQTDQNKFTLTTYSPTDVVSSTNNIEEQPDSDSDLEYYKQVERQRAAKLAAKSNKHSRTTEVPFLTDATHVIGKCSITTQIEKNRGLTHARKKLIKNPRKNNRLKYEKKEVCRSGQVRKIRKPTGSHGGEASGINSKISRSVRF